MKSVSGLKVAEPLLAFVNEEVLPGTGVEPSTFWDGLARIVAGFGPRHRDALLRRDELQARLDAWHRENPGDIDVVVYRRFLEEIGYLVEPPGKFEVSVEGVDPEIASIAGPQLVVPVNNARYALNAANARWGSLYDALYGSDAIDEDDGAERTDEYNPARGTRVVAWANALLDDSLSLVDGRHGEVSRYRVVDGALEATLPNDTVTTLADGSRLIGYTGPADTPERLAFEHHGLHVELVIDRDHPVGRNSVAGVADVILEAALSTIQDCEDSVAAVDAEDKVGVYRNWLGLMKGDLTERLEKNGKTFTRSLVDDREYSAPDGGAVVLPGRSLMLVRHVGAHMTTDAVRDADDVPIVETLLDALVTAAAAMHDLAKPDGAPRNSRAGSVYVVKPKQHGPDEVALAVELFASVETVLGLPERTLKIGIMDEERRTSVNLAACLYAARDRVIFINTGFLDRTGDEIHTSMLAGTMVPKGEMKSSTWLNAYEDNNVDVGLAAGLPGKGQIGKGMWAMPDHMEAMLETKQAHPESGANTAWVPSPTAAVLHATHYHRVDVAARQAALVRREAASLDALLTVPTLEPGRNLDDDDLQHELDNNAQSILGYVVRWIDQGVGCSKVPDINDIALMEDRATLRISSQILANWLAHDLVSETQVRDALERMAAVVDEQNEHDSHYRPIGEDFETNIAFQAALDLILKGHEQPNGYTEFILTTRRRERKMQLANG